MYVYTVYSMRTYYCTYTLDKYTMYARMYIHVHACMHVCIFIYCSYADKAGYIQVYKATTGPEKIDLNNATHLILPATAMYTYLYY